MKIKYSLMAALAALLLAGTAQADGHANHGLDAALEMQDDDHKARYQYRNPKATLEFFGIQPGMSVGEALPGGGWYSKILLPYLGSDGQLLGVDYAYEIWPNFSFVNEEFLEKRKTWTETWLEEAKPWSGENGASLSAATFATMPEDAAGTLDAFLFIRALHNLFRYEEQGGFATTALAAAYNALKPGGIVGVVQHEAREDTPDEGATGNRGYLKKAAVIAAMEEAGFEFVGEADINQNDKDQPGNEDIVWRLPPTLFGTKDDEELKAKVMEIGESNRMTLKFVKPAE